MTTPNKDLLVKGILCACIGLAVVGAPYLVHAPVVRATLASVSLIGWFVLAMGVTLLMRHIKAHRAETKKSGKNSQVLKPRKSP